PHGSNTTSPWPAAYLARLRGCNVATLVSKSYEEVIIFLHAPGDRKQTTTSNARATTTPPTGARSYLTKRLSSKSASAEAWTPRSCGSLTSR
ncbi:MAG: hypothetical protein ACKPKO_64005, partial [Candidatus Fonsibacter sp.]